MQSFRGADGNTCQPLTSPCNLPLGMRCEIHQQVIGRSSAGRGELSLNYLTALSVEPDALSVSRKVLLLCGRTFFGSVPTNLNELISFMSSPAKTQALREAEIFGQDGRIFGGNSKATER